jgi:hypothetical protein
VPVWVWLYLVWEWLYAVRRWLYAVLLGGGAGCSVVRVAGPERGFDMPHEGSPGLALGDLWGALAGAKAGQKRTGCCSKKSVNPLVLKGNHSGMEQDECVLSGEEYLGMMLRRRKEKEESYEVCELCKYVC